MQHSGENQGVRPPLPPFDEESARQKVEMALWRRNAFRNDWKTVVL